MLLQYARKFLQYISILFKEMYVRDAPYIYEVVEILTVSTKQHEIFIVYNLYTICDVGCFECSQEQIKAYCRKIIATMYQLLLPLIC